MKCGITPREPSLRVVTEVGELIEPGEEDQHGATSELLDEADVVGEHVAQVRHAVALLGHAVDAEQATDAQQPTDTADNAGP